MCWPSSSSISTIDPTLTSSSASSDSSTSTEWSRRERSVRMRASSKPCSFFAAWYSKFSDRSFRAFELGELSGERVSLARGEMVDSRLVHAPTAYAYVIQLGIAAGNGNCF